MVNVFNEAGYRVIATDVMAKPADLICHDYIVADLKQYAEDQTYAESINGQLRASTNGRLDVLINNAAIQILAGVDDLTRAAWQTTLNVNLVAPFLFAQALLPELERAKGSIINIGSIHSRLTKRNFVAYATSKAALAGMTRALAVDLGPRVRVNCIEPAAIETDMLKAGFEGKANLYAQLEHCHPQHRIGQPDEVARLALAIAQGGMNFLHGACIGLDGGIGNRLFDPD